MDTSGSPRPLGPLILLIAGVLFALAVFWVGFMLAPAAVLLISYLALSAGERASRQQREQSSRLEGEGELDAVAGAQAAPSGVPAPGAQIGARRVGEAGLRHQTRSPAEAELVRAGSVSSQQRGARS
jgi:hypothetical protein